MIINMVEVIVYTVYQLILLVTLSESHLRMNVGKLNQLYNVTVLVSVLV